MKLSSVETAMILIALENECNKAPFAALKQRVIDEGLSWGCQQARAGSAKTAKKAASSAANGKLGGRPKKLQPA